jgi:hypothetical protein
MTLRSRPRASLPMPITRTGTGLPPHDGRPVVFDLSAPLGAPRSARGSGYLISFLGFLRLEGVILMVRGTGLL